MKSPILAVALPLALLSAGPALAQSMCVIAGDPAIMGANMSAAFDVQAGQGCMSDIRPQGTLSSSEISQRPQHGTLKMVDKDTWTYEPAPGYKGSDSFAITAQGQSIDQKPGTSVLSYRVNVR
ncbi:Ig-like domain-containing protein [Microvirga sp. ACRRW]|uniref:Ig-like domain-containing protein n=1 Tax=Microvirga sp. ACRRW TaxID=2918205 RepID=UPI001EF6B2B3|nr:Ig-like domain-containing protein [Microvirga sp. ACRRW]MCG7394178.1 Ig-like domain-containing protein [Microvirga sp. ACRRW]